MSISKSATKRGRKMRVSELGSATKLLRESQVSRNYKITTSKNSKKGSHIRWSFTIWAQRWLFIVTVLLLILSLSVTKIPKKVGRCRPWTDKSRCWMQFVRIKFKHSEVRGTTLSAVSEIWQLKRWFPRKTTVFSNQSWIITMSDSESVQTKLDIDCFFCSIWLNLI